MLKRIVQKLNRTAMIGSVVTLSLWYAFAPLSAVVLALVASIHVFTAFEARKT
jgi:hypothetical protein